MHRKGVRLAILDEPCRGLDRSTRSKLLTRAREHWRGATMLCITHDVGETLSFERVLVIEDGRIVEDASPAALAAQEGSRYRQMLDMEESVRHGLWANQGWRRWWLEDGKLKQTLDDLERFASGLAAGLNPKAAPLSQRKGDLWEDRASFLGPRASGPSLPITRPAPSVVGCRETAEGWWRGAFRKGHGGIEEIAHKKNAPEARGPRTLGKPPRVAQVGLFRLRRQGAGRPLCERPWGSTRRPPEPARKPLQAVVAATDRPTSLGPGGDAQRRGTAGGVL
jgi:hypothetical protein